MANLYRAANEIDATLNKIMLIGEVIELQLIAIANGEYPPTPQEVIDDGEPENFVLKNFDYNELLNRAIATALSMENTYAEGGHINSLINSIYAASTKEEKGKDPHSERKYTISEEEADRLGLLPDPTQRNHRPDEVKLDDHPTSPTRGRFTNESFILNDRGMQDPNYTLWGARDNGDGNINLMYGNSFVLPEITVSPREKYVHNTYDNIKYHLKSNGGNVNIYAEGGDTNLLDNQDFINQFGIAYRTPERIMDEKVPFNPNLSREDQLAEDINLMRWLNSSTSEGITKGSMMGGNGKLLSDRYYNPLNPEQLKAYADEYATMQSQVSRKEEREVEKAQGDRNAEYIGNGLANMLTLGWARPSLWAGMFAENSDRPYLERLFAGTTGLMQDELWIKEHPYLSEMLNIGFDLITGDLLPTGRMMFNDAANRYPALVQYPRYYYGKYVKYPGTELPTIYRKFKGTDITTEGNNIVLTRTPSRFAYETTGVDPQITNMTTDIPVLSHGDGNWDIGATLATKGKNLLKYKVTSTRPSDTFTVGLKIKVPKKNTVVISGDIDELNALNDNGIKTVTNDKLQAIHDKAEMEFNQNQNQRFNLGKPDYSKYAREVQSVTRDMFRSPTAEDYQLMDYVFRPMYESLVAPTYMRDIYLSDMYNAPEWFTDIWSNSARRRRLGNLDGNVIYDPMTQVDDIYRRERGIGLLRDIPLSVQLLWNTNK